MTISRTSAKKNSKGVHYKNGMPLSEERVATMRDKWDKYIISLIV